MVRPTVASVGLASKLFLRFGCKEVQVNGLDRFMSMLLDEKRRKEGRGLLTYANHISVLDEPTIWGTLPLWTTSDARTTRWTLGASDIMFTNRVFSSFFRRGQVIETERGRGIFQPAIDTALDKLDAGQWVHLFPEGYVNLSRTTELRRFKWGISRLLMEANNAPLVVPMWLTGFDQIMPEPRSWPRFLPRLGKRVSITFGEPVNDSLAPLLDAWHRGERVRIRDDAMLPEPNPARHPLAPAHPAPASGWPAPLPGSRSALSAERESLDYKQARSQIAAFLRAKMAALGANVRLQRGEGLGEGPLAHAIHSELLAQGSQTLGEKLSTGVVEKEQKAP